MTEEEKQQKHFDRMTKEPVSKLLVQLSIPTIISMMITNLYNIADTAFVGTLGTSESGATGVVFGYMSILQALAFMCGQGAGSIMARKLGEKNTEEATMYTSTGFYLSFSLGLVAALLSLVFLTPLVTLLGSTETIAPYSRIYILCIMIAAPFFTSSYTMNNLLRYESKASLGTIGMMTGAVLNLFMDALFMFVFKFGIAGAGLATAISQIVSFFILLYMLSSGKTQTTISIKKVARRGRVYWDIISTGFPSLLRQGLNSMATMFLNSSAKVYGDAAVAAMSIVSRISFFPTALAIGIGQGFQPISSFNFGAGYKDRVRKAFIYALTGSAVILAVIAVPMFIFAGPLVKILRNDPQVIEIGIRALRLMCFAQILVSLSMMVEMGFQSTGARLLASISSCLRSGLVFIPVLFILRSVRGLEGIEEAQPLSFVISFIVAIWLCRKYLQRLKN